MKTKQTFNRRDFIGMTVVSGATLIIQSCGTTLDNQNKQDSMSPAQQPIRVRKNVEKLLPTEKDVLKKVIKKMKDLSDDKYNGSDKYKSLVNLAQIHKEMCGNPDVNKRVHQSWLFLPWHRAYLYYFEQIARSFDGCKDFTIPYWDWTNPNTREFPSIFWDNDLELYQPPSSWGFGQSFKRKVKKGDKVNYPDLDRFESILNNKDFIGIVAPVRRSAGQLESGVHYHIHTNFVGGVMQPPETAALDPIFWVHHANIDRLWSKWMFQNPSRTPTPNCPKCCDENCDNDCEDCCNNPYICQWLDTSVEGFYDVKNVPANPKIRDLLDTYNNLGYRYEDHILPEAPFPIGNSSPLAQINLPGYSIQSTFSSDNKVNINESKSFNISIPQKIRDFVITNIVLLKNTLAADQPSSQPIPVLLLSIEVEKPSNPEISVNVFINVPKDENPVKLPIESPYYVATFSFFENIGGHNHGNKDVSESTGYIFDITETILNLSKLNELKPFNFDEASVSICPQIFQDISDKNEGKITLLSLKFEVAK